MNMYQYIILKAMEPMTTGIKCPKANRFGYKTVVWTCDKIEKTVHRHNTIPEVDECKYIMQEITEFDFINEFEGFLQENELKAKKLDWEASWNPVVVGDRLYDYSTGKLYKIIGFNGGDNRSEIYFDIA